jgi:hypothetical protein
VADNGGALALYKGLGFSFTPMIDGVHLLGRASGGV